MAMSDQATVESSRTREPSDDRSFLETINPLTLPGRAWRRFFYRVYRPIFCQQNYIFRHEGPFPPEVRDDCTFVRYESFDDLPESVIRDISTGNATRRLDMDRRELEEHSLMWIAMVDGHAACTVFTRDGKYYRRWFLEIEPNDVIVFRLWTDPAYRGRGLAPSLMRHALYKLMRPGGHAYIDCRTYNKPSIRCIEKSGFKCVAKKRTIRRDWALYD